MKFPKLSYNLVWYLFLFLLPIFALPFFDAPNDFFKEKFFLLALAPLLIGPLFRILLDRQLVIKISPLFIWLGLFLLSFLLSSIFSLFPLGSFLGSTWIILDYFLLFLFFCLFAIFIGWHFSSKDYRFLFGSFLLGLALGEIITIGMYLGGKFVSNSPSFPFNKFSSIPLLNVVMLPLVIAFLFEAKSRFQKVFSLFILTIFLSSLIIFNFQLAWILLIVLNFLFLFFGLFSVNSSSKRVGLGALLAILTSLAIVFIFSPIQIAKSLPLEASPSFSTQIYVIKEAFKHWKNLFIGQGPGTFVFAYSLYKPTSLNQTIFWGTRFTSGSATFFDWLVTKGVVGGITFLLLFIATIFVFIKSFRQNNSLVILAIALGLAALLFLSFVYVFSFIFWVFLWLIVAYTLHLSASKTIEVRLSSSVKRVIFSLLVVITIMLILVTVIIKTQQFVSSYYCFKAIQYSRNGKIEKATLFLEKATRIYSFDDFYWRNLAQAYLLRADQIARDPNISEENKKENVMRFVQTGQRALEKAIKLSPHNVANWNIAGYFYRNLIGIQGAGELALSAYRKAIQLEPTSPFSYTELARVYILMAQDFARKDQTDTQQEALSLAIKNLNKALELKPNYSPALYLLAVAYDQKGELKKAIEFLEKTSQIAPQDAGVWFQLGMLYWRDNQLEKAKEAYQRAIQIKSDYSDALYMLGLVYDKLQNKEKAIELFEKVAELNPNNQEVQKILTNLHQGKNALEGIVRIEKPLQEEESQVGKEF